MILYTTRNKAAKRADKKNSKKVKDIETAIEWETEKSLHIRQIKEIKK
jgi:hypothetical protein